MIAVTSRISASDDACGGNEGVVQVRAAAVAGRFYPLDEGSLRSEIEGYLRCAGEALGPGPGRAGGVSATAPKAIIAPHAGTIYSGSVAASAYVRLAARRAQIQRVVLLGPSHRVWFEGVGTSSAEAFESPLGRVPVDRDMVVELERLDGVLTHDEAHRREHSLEVHLPFLQVVLGSFALVPLVVGQATGDAVCAVLEACWGGDETAVVVSTDLSHFHDYDTARAIDAKTCSAIAALDTGALNGEMACGFQPVRGLLEVAHRRSLTVELVDLRNSGDTAGSKREVVGYASFVVH